MKRHLLVALIALFAFTVSLPAKQAAVRRFGFDDFSKVKRVSDPQFSPDGASIAFVVSEPNLDENRHRASVFRLAVAGGEPRMVVDGAKYVSVSFPRWSPDGKRLAFLSNGAMPGAPEAQVFVVSNQGGVPKQLTKSPSNVQQIAWSPDGATIAFAAADVPEKKPGYQRWNNSFEVQLNFHLFMTAPVPPTHVWTVPSAGGTASRLTSGEWTLPVTRPPGAPSSIITWTPDGKAVVFSRSGGGGLNLLHAVTVADRTLKPLNIGGTHPRYSPKGDQIVSITGGAMVASTAGGPGKILTQAIDRGIVRALWMPDGQSLIVGGNDTERVSIWRQPLDGAAVKIDTGDVSPNSNYFIDMSISPSGAIAFTGTTPTRPGELYYMASLTTPAKRLTHMNDEIASLPLGKSEVINYTFEKFAQNGILTYPPGFDPSKKYPLVLLIHGGPRAASMMTFGPGVQLMAAKGWLVFQPNYRGSDNLGREFQAAINNDAGAGPGRDVVAGIEAIKQKGFVDETRMAVSGWSYGGYMTTWMLGNYPTMWKAGVAGAAVTDRIDQQNFSDGAGGRGGTNSPWLNPEQMASQRDQSPITYAGKIKAPTLILANTGDYRVPITQSYKLFHALRDAGVTTQFIAYPINAHNATDPVRQRDVQERWIGWLEKYLNDAPVSGGIRR